MTDVSTPLAIVTQMIAHYNAQDADAYVALMTDDACEASYRGAVVVREGEGGKRASTVLLTLLLTQRALI